MTLKICALNIPKKIQSETNLCNLFTNYYNYYYSYYNNYYCTIPNHVMVGIVPSVVWFCHCSCRLSRTPSFFDITVKIFKMPWGKGKLVPNCTQPFITYPVYDLPLSETQGFSRKWFARSVTKWQKYLLIFLTTRYRSSKKNRSGKTEYVHSPVEEHPQVPTNYLAPLAALLARFSIIIAKPVPIPASVTRMCAKYLTFRPDLIILDGGEGKRDKWTSSVFFSWS